MSQDKIKCDACGKFVSYGDLAKGVAKHALVTPDSHYSQEQYETVCGDCNKKESPLDLEKKIKEKKEAIRQLEEDVLELEEKLDSFAWVKQDSIIKLKGESLSFRCHCGCNVFRAHIADEYRYKCNSCGEVYQGE